MQRYMKGMSNGGRVYAHAGESLDNETLKAAVPSLFATEAHESRSQRFVPIPTINVVDGLRREGFEPFEAQQARVRDMSRHEFTRHVIRLRHRSLSNANGDSFEIILSNANDGTSSYNMLPGFFRFVCMNGLYVGDTFDAVRVRHTGDAVQNVIEGAYGVLSQAPRVTEAVDRFRGVHLSDMQQNAFARLAHMARFPNAWEVNEETGRPELVERVAPIAPGRLLEARRSADSGSDLWTVFNRVQENAVKGGQRGWIDGKNGPRRGKVREVNGIAQKGELNRKLWSLADEMEALATA